MYSKQQEDIVESIALTQQIHQKLSRLVTHSKVVTAREESEQEWLVSSKATNRELMKLKKKNQELLEDNQQLCNDVVRLTQQKSRLKGKLVEHKQYISYLEQHNKKLQKQLLLWMRKPQRCLSSQPHDQNIGKLRAEVFKLMKENQTKQNELESLKKTLDFKFFTTPQRTKHKKFINITGSLKKIETAQSSQREQQKINKCTSCNYKGHSKSKKKAKASHMNRYHSCHSHPAETLENLCTCHRQYIKTRQFLQ